MTEAASTTSAPRILVIDDDHDYLEICRMTLEQAGYQVETSPGGAASLETVLREGRPDLILLDFMMPKMDGVQTMKLLETFMMTAKAPVIFVSAMGDRKFIMQALAKGARDYLVKPVLANELLDAVRTHLKPAGPR